MAHRGQKLLFGNGSLLGLGFCLNQFNLAKFAFGNVLYGAYNAAGFCTFVEYYFAE